MALRVIYTQEVSCGSEVFDPKPHCYHPTELCHDGAERWVVTQEFVDYIQWLRSVNQGPKNGKVARQYATVANSFVALLRWLNRPGNCLSETDNVADPNSGVTGDRIHRIPVGSRVGERHLPDNVERIWMGELYSEHDRPFAAHRVYFGDVSDLEGQPPKRVVVGGGGTKDQVRTNKQTADIAHAMASVWQFADSEGSKARPHG